MEELIHSIFSNEFPKPFVPRSLTYEIDERITSQGTILTKLDEESVKSCVTDCLSKSVESIGVCLLWSISNSAHEEKIEAIIKSIEPNIPVTLSSRLNPSLREYRRASSACIDASLKPLMFEYLDGLERRMRGRIYGRSFNGNVSGRNYGGIRGS